MPTTHPTRTKLTDLPQGLQCHILSFLSDERRNPPITISLDSAKRITAPLPKYLLPVAQASPHLAALVADLLGKRAEFITANVTKKHFSKWVTALTPFVKAVSTYDAILEWRETTAQDSDDKLNELVCSDTISVFRTLSGDTTGLEVLDVRNVPFEKCPSFADDLLTGLVNVLERNSPSLRELAVPATELCAIAIGMVSLMKLDVAELELRIGKDRHSACSGPPVRSGVALQQMLRALDGHADRSRKLSTLCELRLKNVVEAPCRDISKSGCRPDLFHAIRRLQLHVTPGRRFHRKDCLVTFISLFPNLEDLDCKGVFTPGRLHVSNCECTNTQMLDSLDRVSSSCRRCDLHHVSRLPETFISMACQGQTKTFVFDGKLTLNQMKILGENSPVLESLTTAIGRENVDGLVSLLRTHCREMRRLHLSLRYDFTRCLGDDGWKIFTSAVQGASDKLREVIVQSTRLPRPLEPAVGTVVQSMVDVLEFLGERARIVRYDVPTEELFTQSEMVDAVCRVLRTCALHTKGLECLEASFGRSYHFMLPYSRRKQPPITSSKLLEEQDKVLVALPNLHSIILGDLGGVYNVGRSAG